MLSSRRAEVRCAAVPSSRGIGLPSAVDDTRDVEDALLGPKKKGGREKGRALRLPSLAGRWRRTAWDCEADEEGGGGGRGDVAAREEGGRGRGVDASVASELMAPPGAAVSDWAWRACGLLYIYMA